MASTYSQISTTTLGSSTASVTLSNIPQTYTNLVLITTVSSARSGNASTYLRLNGDTASNYSFTVLYGDGSSAFSTRGSSQTEIWYGQTNGFSTTNAIGQYAYINQYSNISTFKSVISRGGHAGQLVFTGVGLWRSTAAITSITIFGEGGFNLIAGNTFTLYGIKGA
jgi:hypothetical protein